jgi:tripeptide aminopeptidase
VLRRAVELAQVPAPTGSEQERAALVRGWWEADGWTPQTDAIGNVWVQVADGQGGGVLVCAHLDTVFPADVPHVVTSWNGTLRGPSVGDDSVGVAALPAVARMLLQGGHGGGPVWLVATLGEEGTGNLAGITHALAHAPGPIAAVIAVEGNYLGRVVSTGVGSVRLRVRYRGPGGHAWERSSAPSAVHAAVEAAAQISSLRLTADRYSVNVATIGGGEAINARARNAWFELDLRAASADVLADLEGRARTAVSASAAGLTAEIEEMGRRPAGSVPESSAIVRAAVTALERVGIQAELGAASTDANAALALGIPAVAIGVTRGQGEHTPAEWIETEPLADGLAALADTIELIREEQC